MYHFDAKTLIKNITVLKFFFIYGDFLLKVNANIKSASLVTKITTKLKYYSV